MKVKVSKKSLAIIREMNALELIELIAYAKRGNNAVIKAASVNSLKEAEEALEWFLEVLEEGA